MSSKNELYNTPFSHIYVEKGAENTITVQKIISKFKNAKVISIDDYRDVFFRPKQDNGKQRNTQALILAVNKDKLIYQGSPMCQNFNNENFYYSSCVMNCIFDCEYCYLKGMYQSANIVVFVNIEDYFSQISELCRDKKIYLCVSYDTDLIALDSVTGYVKKWADFTSNEPNLSVEIRTKSFRRDLYDKLEPCERVIFAYTVSPDEVISKYEHKTSSLKERLEAAQYAIKRGFKVRFCFDPMIYCENYKQHYSDMVNKISEYIDWNDLWDVSMGSFRISKEYLKDMRKNYPYSAVCQFPFDTVEGVCQYPKHIKDEMEKYLFALLTKHMDKDKIFEVDY
ncbi:MAG: radical SAM protein [Clostridia bacterium]|nr:radical SAM protein [Clostridia bacterium]